MQFQRETAFNYNGVKNQNHACNLSYTVITILVGGGGGGEGGGGGWEQGDMGYRKKKK